MWVRALDGAHRLRYMGVLWKRSASQMSPGDWNTKHMRSVSNPKMDALRNWCGWPQIGCGNYVVEYKTVFASKVRNDPIPCCVLLCNTGGQLNRDAHYFRCVIT